MRIAFAGTPDVAIPSLRALASSHDICCVITRPDAPAGRGRALTPSPVAQAAADLGLKTLTPVRLVDVDAQLRAHDLDAVAVVAYGGLVPASMLTIPRYGWINLHFSLLPAWRGAAPVQRAIMAGDDITGACTFRIEEGLDTGPVFGSVTRAISNDDTATSLLTALAEDGAHLLSQTIADIAHLQSMPQSADGVSHAPKLDKGDARIIWGDPALAVSRRIRGCTNEPGAWTEVDGQRMVIAPVVLASDRTDLAPGAIAVDGTRILVGTGSHAVALTDVKPAGKAWMKAADWFRGLRTTPVFSA